MSSDTRKEDSHRGFDSPVESKKDDLLSRWHFAQQIARIAMESPRSWSVRIGIYGGWGEGKTSVLRMVDSIAKDNGHFVVRFNPWGCEDSDQLWAEFIQKIGEVIRTGAPETAQFRRQIDRDHRLRKAEKFGQIAKDVHPIAGVFASTGLSKLERWIRENQRDLVEIVGADTNKRVIVMIDDLDRANPELLPQILFSLNELLDLPGYSFVLAVDPNRVGQVLAKLNPEWADGKQFLQKIVDFPRHLPPLTTTHTRKLARNWMSEFCDFIPEEDLEAVIDLIPPNPRFVKQLIRQIWALEPVVVRHDPDALDWECVLLSQLLYERWPHVWQGLFGDAEGLVSILEDHYKQHDFASISRDEEKKEPKTALYDKLDQLFPGEKTISGGEPENERKQARQILQRLANPHRRGQPENLIYNASLPAHHPAITRKEFGEARALWSSADRSPQVLKEWILRQEDLGYACLRDIVLELINAAVQTYVSRNSDAVEEPMDSKIIERMKEIYDLPVLIEHLVVRVLPMVLPDETLPSVVFKEILDGFREYAHFVEPVYYSHARKLERWALFRVSRSRTIKPDTSLDVIRTLEDHSFSDRREYRNDINQVENHLRWRLAREMVSDIRTGRYPIEFDNEAYEVRLHAFLSKDSPFWENVRIRDRFIDHLSKPSPTENDSIVAARLARMIARELGSGPYFLETPNDVTELVVRHATIVVDLWRMAVSHRLNRRWVGPMRNTTVPALEGTLGLELYKPPWWIELSSD